MESTIPAPRPAPSQQGMGTRGDGSGGWRWSTPGNRFAFFLSFPRISYRTGAEIKRTTYRTWSEN